MSLAEMKESAKQLSAEELEDLALHVEFLRRSRDAAWRAEMLHRASSPDKLHTEAEVIALHERLISEGK